MAATNAHYLFYGYSGASTVVTRVELQCATAACPASGSYQIRAGLVNTGSTWTNSSWITLTNASHAIEIDFRAGITGSLKLYLDNVQQANLTNINNNTRKIDMVRLGPVAGIDTGTRGTEYFDAFESRRRSYIGLMASLGYGKVLAAPAWRPNRGRNPSPAQGPLFQAGDPVTIDYTYDPLYRLTVMTPWAIG